MQWKGEFVYSNGTFTEVYPPKINNIMQEAEILQELCEDVGIPDNLNSDRAP